MIRLVYQLLVHLAALIALPALALLMLLSARARRGLGQRLGRYPQLPPASSSKRRVWLHCASVGEVQTAGPLIEKLLADDRLDLVLSTITPEGQDLAQERYGKRLAVFYWPAEFFWAVGSIFRLARPEALLILETELWPAVLHRASAQGLPIAVLNARISDKTFGRYRRLRPFLEPALQAVRAFSVQSELYAGRLASMGILRERIRVTGNLKFDLGLDRETELARPCFLDDFWPDKAPLFVAASTHAGEEKGVIEAYIGARRAVADLRLVVAPRHLERVSAICSALDQAGLFWRRRSLYKPDEADKAERPAVLVLDTIGELVGVMARGDLVFVGGSLVNVGGHNVLESAALGVATLFGPHMENFRQARDVLLDSRGGIEAAGQAQLAELVARLLTDDRCRREIGERGRQAVAANRGATDANLAIVRQVLGLDSSSS